MIAVVNPPSPPSTRSNKDTMGGLGQLYGPRSRVRMPPLDMLYVAAVIRASGRPVRVHDGLVDESPVDVTGLQTAFVRTSAPTLAFDLRFAADLARRSDAQVYLFGPRCSDDPASLAASEGIAGVLDGEPEPMIVPLLEGRDPAGVWRRNAPPAGRGEPVESLDELPFPAWDLVPVERYHLPDPLPYRGPGLTIAASRGCPFGCSYCPYPVVQGRRWRTRSVRSVVDELAWLQERFRPGFVLFRDPEFTLDRARAMELMRAMVSAGIRTPWRAETRIDTLDLELLGAMREAGCVGVNLGIESFDRSVLEAVHRKWIPEAKVQEIVSGCRRLGIRTFCFFVIGLPGETRAGVERMVKEALALEADAVQFTVATPYPGTELARWARERGYGPDGAGRGSLADGTTSGSLTSYDSVMRNEHLTVGQIDALRAEAEAMWRAGGVRQGGWRGRLEWVWWRLVRLPLARARVARAFA